MIRNIQKDGGGSLLIGTVSSTLFGRDMDVLIYGDTERQVAYAEKCAVYFNDMPDELVRELRTCSLRYCEDMRPNFNPGAPEVPEGISADRILDYVRPNSLIVSRPKQFDKIAFSVEMSCDGEPEHGMEWVINDGQVLYVSDFMGISPWYAPSVYQTECRSYVYEDFSL